MGENHRQPLVGRAPRLDFGEREHRNELAAMKAIAEGGESLAAMPLGIGRDTPPRLETRVRFAEIVERGEHAETRFGHCPERLAGQCLETGQRDGARQNGFEASRDVSAMANETMPGRDRPRRIPFDLGPNWPFPAIRHVSPAHSTTSRVTLIAGEKRASNGTPPVDLRRDRSSATLRFEQTIGRHGGRQ